MPRPRPRSLRLTQDIFLVALRHSRHIPAGSWRTIPIRAIGFEMCGSSTTPTLALSCGIRRTLIDEPMAPG